MTSEDMDTRADTVSDSGPVEPGQRWVSIEKASESILIDEGVEDRPETWAVTTRLGVGTLRTTEEILAGYRLV